ncbi:MAG TPA: hypothetical protein VN784_02775 [Candidatus Limnocylindrales bacterium]|nr:hypothetical protein [Candidatus Limnocylindrales bacterium]
MKTGCAATFSSLVALILVTLVIAGCATTRPVDWNSRVGGYTFDQAVTELGPPDKQAKLSDGKTVAEWITRRSGGTSFSVGTGFYGGNTGVGVGQTVGTGYSDRVLTLTFGTNNVLTAWSKNY